MTSALRRRLDYIDKDNAYPMMIAYRCDGWTIGAGPDAAALRVIEHDGNHLVIKLDGQSICDTVVRGIDQFHVFTGGAHAVLRYSDPMAHAGEAEFKGGRLTAPMPGKIVAIHVRQGDAVEKGAPFSYANRLR